MQNSREWSRHEVISERHVQAIWYDAALRPQNLVTRRGQAVRVVSPGEWNLGSGPDFLHAVMEIGGDRRRVVGDVEVHLAPTDWDVHGHGSDPKYRNVIAHVTWGCGPSPSSLPPGAVSIWLGRFVTADTTFSPRQIDLKAYPFARLPLEGRPCERWLDGNPDLARQVLAAAGRRRLALKARRLTGRLCERAARSTARSDGGNATPTATDAIRRQVFYEEVMTALGYSKNSVQFRHISERIPIASLPRERLSAQTAFLVAGGFETWDRSGLRPWNSPERRLASAAEVFTETNVMELRGAADFSRRGCRAMLMAMGGEMRVCEDGSRRRCMGRGRAAAVVANVVTPFAMAEERIVNAPDWLPPEDISEPARLTAFRLFGRDHNPAALYATNGLLIQGLLQIHRDCCQPLYPDCETCRLASRPV